MKDRVVILPEQRFQNCELCEQGQFLNIYRLSVRSSIESRPVLVHAHYSESLQTLLARLCDEYPAIWQQNTVYYFYMDMGGVYHHVEDTTWLRDKDQLIVTTIDDAELFPKLNLMAGKISCDLKIITYHFSSACKSSTSCGTKTSSKRRG